MSQNQAAKIVSWAATGHVASTMNIMIANDGWRTLILICSPA